MNSSTIWQTNTKDHQYKTSNIGTDADKEWNNDFYFVQGADCQLGMMASFEPDYKPETSKWDEEIRLANLAVQKVNRLNPKPRFFIICGDLTHQMPSNEPALIEVKQRQIDDFKKIFSKMDPSIPLVCVCGNHDVGDFPTVESVQKYRSTFGDDYFSFWCGGVLFIVLNSQYYKERTEDVVKLAEEQDRWLDEVLCEAKGHRIICFAHVPWFINDVNEKLGVFNIPMEWRIKMLEKLYSAGVRFMFCGHYHQNGGGFYKDLEVVVTSAIGKQLGKDKSGLRIVKVTKDNVVHKYHEFDTFPTNLNSIL